MNLLPFDSEALKTVLEAHDIAEDRLTNFYKFSIGQWKRHRYDVKTLHELKSEEIASNAFALLNRCARVKDDFEFKTKDWDFYFICIQDHEIRKALKSDYNLKLLPLLVYVFTHELVHIVRFCNFSQRFDVTARGRAEEERLVHEITFKILKGLSLSELDYVLASYAQHRTCELMVS